MAHHPNVLLLVVGAAPNNALYAQTQTPESILAAAEKCGVAQNLKFLGSVSDETLSELYRSADLHVFPVRPLPGDPEGFGMVAIEAAAHGLPTVAFATGGVVDAVAENRSGYLVSTGDYAALAKTISRNIPVRDALRESARQFAEGFAWDRFGTAMMKELLQLL